VKEVQRDGIDPVFTNVVERTKRIPVTRAARFDNLPGKFAVAQMNRQRFRRCDAEFSSISAQKSAAENRENIRKLCRCTGSGATRR